MTDNTPPVGHCQCAACKGGTIHASDCSVHNAPALPVGACDCEHSAPPLPDERIEELAAQMEASDPTDSFWKTFARSVEAEARAPLLAEIDRLKAQVAKLQKDAARYRWLRRALADRSDGGKSHWFCSIRDNHPEELDEAIDTAMKEKP